MFVGPHEEGLNITGRDFLLGTEVQLMLHNIQNVPNPSKIYKKRHHALENSGKKLKWVREYCK